MAQFTRPIITQSGLALMAKTLANEDTISFMKISTSSTVYNPSQLENLTSITGIQQETLVAGTTIVDISNVQITAALNNKDLIAGYVHNTTAFWVQDSGGNEILYAVSIVDPNIPNNTAIFMPPFSGGSTGVIFNVLLQIGNADQVILEPSPAALATARQVYDINNELLLIWDAMGNYVHVNRLGVANGVATLEGSGRLPNGQLPTSATANRVLRVGAANSNPVWGQVNLATDVIGMLSGDMIARPNIPDNANLNNYTTSGIFHRASVAHVTNAPTSGWFVLYVDHVSSQRILQTIHLERTGSGARIFQRIFHDALGWSTWSEISRLDANGRLPLTNTATSATANRVLRVGTANSDPVYAQVALGTDVSGQLPLGNAPRGAANTVLRGTGTGSNPAFGQIQTADIADNAVTAAKIANVQHLGRAISIGDGAQALSNMSGVVNTAVAIGNNAEATNASVAIGDRANAATASNQNIAIGIFATVEDGSHNTALGASARVITGTHNTALGHSARMEAVGSEGGAAVGRGARVTHVTSMVLTPNNGSTFRSSNATNQILLGFSGITPTAFAALSNISDQRDKTEITGLKYDALDFINAVQPKQYRMDFRSDYIRYEEITDLEFEKLDKYTQLHEVSNVQVFGIESTDIEWIEDEVFLEGESTSVGIMSLSNNDQSLENRYATKFISKFAKNREAALAEVISKRSEVGIEVISNRLEITRDNVDVAEIAETDIESLIKPTRKTKFLRVFVEPDGTRAGKRYHNGFLAQQVEQAAKDMGFDFAGVKYMAHNKDENGVPEGDDLYSLTYEEFIAPMVGAIQQLSIKNNALEERNGKLEKRLQKLEEALNS